MDRVIQQVTDKFFTIGGYLPKAECVQCEKEKPCTFATCSLGTMHRQVVCFPCLERLSKVRQNGRKADDNGQVQHTPS